MSFWQQLEITCSQKDAEMIADLLHEHGALSVTLSDAGDQPLFQLAPEETPLWRQTKITALFSQQTDVENIMQRISVESKLLAYEHRITQLQEQDWVRQTQQHFPPKCFAESLWVIPSWSNIENFAAPVVRIDPGLAFGTGTHPTTALCLQWLAKNPPDDQLVIDYGCGSGILALAALALKAKLVFAVDHDLQALQATQNNALLNHFPQEKLQILPPEEMPTIKANLIIANILSRPLISLVSRLNELAAPDATLILSGILTRETDDIANAYAPYFTLTSATTEEEWTQLTLTRIATPGRSK